jgi:hypothetical protein
MNSELRGAIYRKHVCFIPNIQKIATQKHGKNLESSEIW